METKIKLVGRSLASLTPAELEEIINLIKPDLLESLSENEGEFNENGDEGRSLHPKYKIVFTTKDCGDEEDGVERIKFWGWTSGETDCGTEWDTYEWLLLAGEVVGPMGDCWEVLPIVRWFLDHGWRWSSGSPVPEERLGDRQFLRDMSRVLADKLPDNYGFILVAMPFGSDPDRRMVYTSNCQRTDAIATLKEFMVRCGSAEEWMRHL